MADSGLRRRGLKMLAAGVVGIAVCMLVAWLLGWPWFRLLLGTARLGGASGDTGLQFSGFGSGLLGWLGGTMGFLGVLAVVLGAIQAISGKDLIPSWPTDAEAGIPEPVPGGQKPPDDG